MMVSFSRRIRCLPVRLSFRVRLTFPRDNGACAESKRRYFKAEYADCYRQHRRNPSYRRRVYRDRLVFVGLDRNADRCSRLVYRRVCAYFPFQSVAGLYRKRRHPHGHQMDFVFDRYYPFTSGVFDITAIAYYISLTVVFLFLTIRIYEKRRWA